MRLCEKCMCTMKKDIGVGDYTRWHDDEHQVCEDGEECEDCGEESAPIKTDSKWACWRYRA